MLSKVCRFISVFAETNCCHALEHKLLSVSHLTRACCRNNLFFEIVIDGHEQQDSVPCICSVQLSDAHSVILHAQCIFINYLDLRTQLGLIDLAFFAHSQAVARRFWRVR